MEDQWRRYAGLSGEWHGVWHRFVVGPDGKMSSGNRFPAVCHMALTSDGQSVRHKNRYTPGSQPPGPPGKIVDGLYEVDFGVFDQAKFRKPFGPHSCAVYSDGAAVVGSASLKASKDMVAVEFVLAGPCEGECRHRRRLVATWRVDPETADGGPVARLASATAIVEVNSAEGLAKLEAGVDRPDDSVLTQWQGVRRITHMDGTSPPECDAEALQFTQAHVLPGGVLAWLPMTLDLQSPKSVAPWMGWRRTEDEFIRAAAVYDYGELSFVMHDVFRA